MFSTMRASWIICFVIIPCALQQPRIIVDLTEDIDQFQKSSDFKSMDNIEKALIYSPNLQYRTGKTLQMTQQVVQELSMLVDKVCKESKNVECDISQINLYFYYDGSVTFRDLEARGRHLPNADKEGTQRQFKSFVYIINGKIVWEAPGNFLYQDIAEEYLKTGLLMSPQSYKEILKQSSSRLKDTVNKYVHRLFISVPISYPNGVPESYPLFRDYFTGVFNLLKRIDENFQGEAWQKFHLAISLNYNGTSTNEQGKTIQMQYQKLILKFMNKLVQEKNINVVISGATIPSNFTRSDFASEIVIGQDVHPITKFYPSSPYFKDNLFDNQLKIHGEFVPPFKTILMDEVRIVKGYIETRTDGVTASVENSVKQTNKTTIVLIRDVVDTPTDLLTNLNILLSSNQSLPKKLDMQIHTVYFGQKTFEPLNPAISQLLKNSHVNLGYSKDLGRVETHANVAKETFKTIPRNVNKVLITFHVNVTPFTKPPSEATAAHYLETVQSPLTEIHEAWKSYQTTSSRDQSLIIDVKIYWDDNIDSPSCGYKAYCNSCISNVNEMFEAILIWGKIHGVNLVINTLIAGRRYNNGWYDYIRGSRHSEIFLPRCQPLRLLGQDNACINQTQKVPSTAIQFSSEFSGITINSRLINAQNLSGGLEEMQVMTQFALNRFNLIEILLVPDEQCTAAKTIEKLLESETFENKSDVRLFLDFPLQPVDIMSLSDQMKCVKKLSETVAKSVGVNISEAGIHLSNWRTTNGLIESLNQVRHSKVNIGLTIRDCRALRESLYNQTLFISTCEKPVNSVDYIVCQIEPVEASNKNLPKMSENLDYNLYFSKIFQQICPKLGVYFRLTSFHKSQRNEQPSSSEFLTFIGDWVQFSSNYQIPMFLAEVVDRPNENTNGWWRITNETDFANPDVYIEKEAEYLLLPTWRPPPKITDSEPKQKNEVRNSQPILTIVIIAASFVIFSLAAVGIIVVVVRYLRAKHQLVIREEKVRAILNGEVFGDNEAETSFGSGFQPNFKYDQKFEITQTDFDFCDAVVLGAGFFGKVYKIQLHNEFVAVKRPNPTCPEQGLISMLEEIKILCYVGDHENVIRFIGCSTKSASKGVIYIATELCENGCLQSYLSKLAPKVKPDADNQTTFHLLNQFSCQIASGMEYIASRRIIHSDLAARNVLLDSHLTCKIGDFGLSRKLYANDLYEKQGHCPMPWRWMAVESLKRREYSTASDVWSFGVTIWEIFSLGDFPYSEISSPDGFIEKLESGLRLTKPVHMTDITFDKICECWNLESCSRPSFTRLKDFFQLTLNEVYVDL